MVQVPLFSALPNSFLEAIHWLKHSHNTNYCPSVSNNQGISDQCILWKIPADHQFNNTQYKAYFNHDLFILSTFCKHHCNWQVVNLFLKIVFQLQLAKNHSPKIQKQENYTNLEWAYDHVNNSSSWKLQYHEQEFLVYDYSRWRTPYQVRGHLHSVVHTSDNINPWLETHPKSCVL